MTETPGSSTKRKKRPFDDITLDDVRSLFVDSSAPAEDEYIKVYYSSATRLAEIEGLEKTIASAAFKELAPEDQEHVRNKYRELIRM